MPGIGSLRLINKQLASLREFLKAYKIPEALPKVKMKSKGFWERETPGQSCREPQERSFHETSPKPG